MKTTAPMELSWNLVAKNVSDSDMLHKKIIEKIAKLETHLQHFPPDAVHLHIAMEKHPKKEVHSVGLTLRLPSNILRSQKSHADPIKAFDDAVRTLLRELGTLKAELRREASWKPKRKREDLSQLRPVVFSLRPLPPEKAPQDEGDVLRDLLQHHHARLLRYVRRHLWHETVNGDLPQGAIEAQAVVDETVRQALSAPKKKPARINYQLWLYQLARHEIAKRRKNLQEQAANVVPLETTETAPESESSAEGYDAEQPLDIIERELEPASFQTEDLIEDRSVETPAEVAARRDLLAEMQRTANTWPPELRETFELYLVEGFEPDEIAMITGQSLAAVQKLVDTMHESIRAELLGQATLRNLPRPK